MSRHPNPHIEDMLEIERQYGLERDHVGIQIADEKGTKEHPGCGTAFYKPTVGRFVCDCGAVFTRGEWREPRTTS